MINRNTLPHVQYPAHPLSTSYLFALVKSTKLQLQTLSQRS